MLIEQCAYGNRWRKVAPAAKGLFCLGGFIAAFAASQPAAAAAVAGLVVLITVLGAGVPFPRFVRVALPPLGFLLLGCLSLAYSLDFQGASNDFTVLWLPSGWAPIRQLAARSGAALAALLFLALTTPMIDLIALLRRLKMPEVLLEIMVLCYRMLFVFSEALHDTRTAQAARLGYATPRLALRSLGSLTANLTLQIWQRAHSLHIAAQSRNNDGAFRFLEPEYAHVRRDLTIAALGGALLIGLAVGMP
ncbi:cobalt ECF transporter T component CbiQ [Propionivibrio limicola]|uniref:cobalt ECF transporter T component CbiQ n=1 Tax=Propionivibrio limicola TaxID=167645 RepID=UPI0012913451|nr:cobalt ECF transporter T component CbiQ [Propionivibrio limicola]